MASLSLSPLETRHLICNTFEGNTLELYNLCGFVAVFFYVSGLTLLDHEETLPPELGSWGVSGITNAFWLP